MMKQIILNTQIIHLPAGYFNDAAIELEHLLCALRLERGLLWNKKLYN